MSNTTEAPDVEAPDAEERDHLTDVEDGCGCTELWEHMSEHRED